MLYWECIKAYFGDSGIEYKPTTEEPKDRTGVYIIIGVILGAVILIALVIIVFILYKRRRRSLDSKFMQILTPLSRFFFFVLSLMEEQYLQR